MNFKKTTAILLALILTVSLMGCGKENEDISGQITPVTEEATVPAGTVQQTQVPETVTETTAAVEETNPVSLGRLEGGVYTNTYAGFGCELDSSWTFYGAEELQELPEQVNELLSDTEYADSGLNQITDMMAENTTTFTTMNVQYQKLDMQKRLVFATMSEEEIIDSVLAQSDSIAEAYAQAGVENAVLEKVTVTFLGEEHTAVRTSTTIQGMNYYLLQLIDYSLGQYSVTLTLSSFLEDNTASLLELFYAVE